MLPCFGLMLQQVLRHLEVNTSGEGFTDLTAALNREISVSGLSTGLALLSEVVWLSWTAPIVSL